MSSQQREYNPHLINDPNAYWPIVTYGECVRRNNHTPYCEVGWLGDGVCMTCWDNGHSSKREKAHNAMTKAKNYLEKHPNSIKLQNNYDDALNAWEDITKDEDKDMKYGGLFDFGDEYK